MANDRVFTGALAIIKVNGIVVGKAKNIRVSETFRRVGVQGLGTAFESEAPVVGFAGTLSASFIEISFKKTGLPGGIRRIFTNVLSQALAGNPSMEDQLVLDNDGITLDVYRKIIDLIDPNTGIIKPKVEPYFIVRNCLIETDSADITEGGLASHDQAYKYLVPITFPS